MIYLDHCATAPLIKEVKESIVKNLDNFGNPSSIYKIGFKAKELIENSRKKIADCLNCLPEEIFFTSGASEANSWALQHPFCCEGYEHHSVLNNFNNTSLDKAVAVAFMYVNNETGFINDIPTLRKKYKNYLFHCDGTQAVGNLEIDLKELNVDTFSFSGHKIGAPKGIGVLYIKKSKQKLFHPIVFGGKQERSKRGGTENVLGVIALGIALELAQKKVAEKEQHCLALRKRLKEKLKETNLLYRINEKENNIPSIFNFTIKGVSGEALTLLLSEKEIYISSGSACNSGTSAPSGTLQYFYIPQEYINGAVRVSFGLENSIEEIDIFVNELQKTVNFLGGK